jgi:hypothetical protein
MVSPDPTLTRISIHSHQYSPQYVVLERRLQIVGMASSSPGRPPYSDHSIHLPIHTISSLSSNIGMFSGYYGITNGCSTLICDTSCRPWALHTLLFVSGPDPPPPRSQIPTLLARGRRGAMLMLAIHLRRALRQNAAPPRKMRLWRYPWIRIHT